MSDLSGRHGLIVGVANKRSISWAIAQAAAAAGARLALTYPSARLEENVRELAATLDNPVLAPFDVARELPRRARRQRLLARRPDARGRAAHGAARRRQHPDAHLHRQPAGVSELQRDGRCESRARV